MAPSLNVVAFGVAGFLWVCAAQIELDNSFLEKKGDDMWLVEFYAPWCGHCKKLEPIFRDVSMTLRTSPVKVGKVDCTRYTEVAAHFNIRGFPTIKFVKGDQVFTHRGDRSSEDILEFVSRAQGPAVRKLSNIGKFNEARSKHADTVFFLYIGDDDEHDELFQKYQSVSDKMLVQGYFYAGKQHILEDIQPKNHPTLLAFKDRMYFEFLPKDGIVTMESVKNWINSERYTAFPQVSGGSINEMADVKKYLVIIVVDPAVKDRMDVNVRIRSIAETVALNQREKYHSDFQFLWMTDVDTVNNIMLSFMDPPVVMVLEVAEHYFYLPREPVANITTDTFTKFLDDIRDGVLEASGGTGFFMRIKRIFYDIFTTVVGIWQTSRWLFLLMFGLPTVIISIICYSLCCMEPIDDSAFEDDEDYEETQTQTQTADKKPVQQAEQPTDLDKPPEGDIGDNVSKEEDLKGEKEKKDD